MSFVMVDSNIFLDAATGDPQWASWSLGRLVKLGAETQLVINAVIYAELAAGAATQSEIDAALPEDLYLREPIPYEAAYLAAKCFVEYRRRGGQRRSPLPDFFIGAHALVKGHRLLTRDPARYQSYFPNLQLISPT